MESNNQTVEWNGKTVNVWVWGDQVRDSAINNPIVQELLSKGFKIKMVCFDRSQFQPSKYTDFNQEVTTTEIGKRRIEQKEQRRLMTIDDRLVKTKEGRLLISSGLNYVIFPIHKEVVTLKLKENQKSRQNLESIEFYNYYQLTAVVHDKYRKDAMQATEEEWWNGNNEKQCGFGCSIMNNIEEIDEEQTNIFRDRFNELSKDDATNLLICNLGGSATVLQGYLNKVQLPQNSVCLTVYNQYISKLHNTPKCDGCGFVVNSDTIIAPHPNNTPESEELYKIKEKEISRIAVERIEKNLISERKEEIEEYKPQQNLSQHHRRHIFRKRTHLMTEGYESIGNNSIFRTESLKLKNSNDNQINNKVKRRVLRRTER